MKNREYSKVICKSFCNFYKPGKEEIKCGSFSFLKRNLSYGELLSTARISSINPELSMDGTIKSLACLRCDFLQDGCDFRMGLSSPPCGGYVIIENLLKDFKPRA